jgi:hypothetical protein
LKKENTAMSNHHNNRVLVRSGARELSRQEVEQVGGGIQTTTKCTFVPPNFKDGDPGEC